MLRTAPGNPLFLRDEAIDLQFELWLLAAAAMQKAVAEPLAEANLDHFDWQLLVIAERHPSCGMVEFVDLTGRPKQVVSRRLQRLETLGFLARQPDPQDRRRRRLGISEPGMALMETVKSRLHRYMRQAFSKAGSQAVEGFSSVLTQLLAPTDARRFGHRQQGRQP